MDKLIKESNLKKYDQNNNNYYFYSLLDIHLAGCDLKMMIMVGFR